MYPNYGKIIYAFLEPGFTNVKIKMTLSIVEQIRFENILNIKTSLKKGDMSNGVISQLFSSGEAYVQLNNLKVENKCFSRTMFDSLDVIYSVLTPSRQVSRTQLLIF